MLGPNSTAATISQGHAPGGWEPPLPDAPVLRPSATCRSSFTTALLFLSPHFLKKKIILDPHLSQKQKPEKVTCGPPFSLSHWGTALGTLQFSSTAFRISYLS